MITVPTQEIATFLGERLDRVLQQTGSEFLQSVASNRQFKAGCALMDVLNAVESVQERIRVVLQERGHHSRGESELELLKVRITALYLLYSLYSSLPIQQHPFLCLFVDIYSTTLQSEQQKPEQFVVSVILNGDGEELAPSKPSELITIAHEAESRPVDLYTLDNMLPEISIEDQVPLGVGWESVVQQRGDRHGTWESFKVLLESMDTAISAGLSSDNTGSQDAGHHVSNLDSVPDNAESQQATNEEEAGEQEESEELEEWEIEAEKHFQGSEDAAPAPAKTMSKTKKAVESTVSRQQLNTIMEQAVIQPLSFDQEQFMLSQFTEDAAKVHIPLPPQEALPGIVDNNPMIAFNLLLYLIQLSSDLEGDDVIGGNQKLNGRKERSEKASSKSSTTCSPEPSIVDGYLDTMTRAKRLTLHSLEVVNRLTGATTLSPRFLHAYIENAVRCCEMVEDKVGQARVVRMLCVFVQSLLRNEAITIPGYYHALQSFCVQFSRVKEVANLFQSLVEYQRKMDVTSSVRVSVPSQQAQQSSRSLTQSASLPSTPITELPHRASWLASSGSISHIKTSLNKHNSLNGFSTPGALSQFIHPGSVSPAGTNGAGHQNGTSPATASFSNGSSSGTYFKTHNKNSSQHSSASGSLFSSPTVMSASVNAFNTGLGNPTSLTLNGANGTNGGTGANPSSTRRAGSGTVTSASEYDLDAAIRASLRDMEAHAGSSSSSGSRGPGSGTSSSATRTPTNGLQQQHQQTSHLGPNKGFNIVSHSINHSRGPGARRGG
ncbi:hypothetical protein BGX28_008228 [Mortierella sp. GBA30]|nr:hypothetical protein BGX28_008228 [Mortierella sp. GBA30]